MKACYKYYANFYMYMHMHTSIGCWIWSAVTEMGCKIGTTLAGTEGQNFDVQYQLNHLHISKQRFQEATWKEKNSKVKLLQLLG